MLSILKCIKKVNQNDVFYLNMMCIAVLKDMCLQTPLFSSLGLVRIYQGYIYFIKNTVQIYIEK